MSTATEGYKRELNDVFSGLFREIFNVVELAVEKEKLESAKDLIGNKLSNAKGQLLNMVDPWFTEIKVSGEIGENPPKE
jgi:hypothetical protein